MFFFFLNEDFFPIGREFIQFIPGRSSLWRARSMCCWLSFQAMAFVRANPPRLGREKNHGETMKKWDLTIKKWDLTMRKRDLYTHEQFRFNNENLGFDHDKLGLNDQTRGISPSWDEIKKNITTKQWWFIGSEEQEEMGENGYGFSKDWHPNWRVWRWKMIDTMAMAGKFAGH